MRNRDFRPRTSWSGSLTRRTLLGRAAGAGALGMSAPALARAAIRASGPKLVFSVPVGSLAGESPAIAAPRPFALVGVQWAGPRSARIELRAQARGGGWSRWVLASVLGHDGDPRSAAAGLFGEPLWTGPAVRVQLRAFESVRGVRLHFVSAELPGVDPDGAMPAAAAAQALPRAVPVLAAGPGQPQIIAREAWSAGAGATYPPEYGRVRMLFVHHTDNPNGYAADQVPALIYSIYLFHRFARGWSDIGYNFVIDAFGRIWEGRLGGIDQAVVGAQAGGYNLESSGVAILGTFDSVIPTGAALQSLRHLTAWKLALHGVPVAGRVTVEVNPQDFFYTPFLPGTHVSLPRIAGHRDGCTTSCPGNALYAQLPAIRSVVAQLVGTQTAVTLVLGTRGVTPATYLSLSDTVLIAGTPVPVHGRLATLAGEPIAGAPIEIQQLTEAYTELQNGGGLRTTVGEDTLATATTAADGSFTAQLALERSTLVRSLHRPAPATTSPLVEVFVAPAVTLTLTPGAPVAVAGTVRPGKPAVTIDAYRVGRGRKPVLSKHVAVTRGAFATTLRLGKGRYWVRARTLADDSNVAGESPRLAVTVSGARD
jgi:N-acetylmuramoyl-L-alanine amidase